MAETGAAVADGANEVDLVMPYRRVGDDPDLVYGLVSGTRSAAGKALLKVILETGELQDEALIRKASEIAIDAGADFIKTSTGKVPVNATPEAARIMLSVIADQGGDVGFKPAGGIKTLGDANLYLDLAAEALGPDWATPRTFRFGASSLLDNLLAILQGGDGSEAGEGY
jgi:deoxyribose-phosphate aldolase